MDGVLSACKEFGVLGGLLLFVMVGILTMFGFGFKWILEQFKVELEGNRKERTEYLGILNKISGSIDDHDKRAEDRGHYVKQEHEKMLDIAKETLLIAGRINGFKKE